MRYDEDELYSIVDAMERFGGSFARSIAHAWHAADNRNKARLQTSFPELFEQYKLMAERVIE